MSHSTPSQTSGSLRSNASLTWSGEAFGTSSRTPQLVTHHESAAAGPGHRPVHSLLPANLMTAVGAQRPLSPSGEGAASAFGGGSSRLGGGRSGGTAWVPPTLLLLGASSSSSSNENSSTPSADTLTPSGRWYSILAPDGHEPCGSSSSGTVAPTPTNLHRHMSGTTSAKTGASTAQAGRLAAPGADESPRVAELPLPAVTRFGPGESPSIAAAGAPLLALELDDEDEEDDGAEELRLELPAPRHVTDGADFAASASSTARALLSVATPGGSPPTLAQLSRISSRAGLNASGRSPSFYGTTAVVRVAALRDVLFHGSERLFASPTETPSGPHFSKRTPMVLGSGVVERPQMACKRVRRRGTQGSLPADREYLFARRAIRFQTWLAEAAARDPEEVNFALAIAHGIVLPAAVRMTGEHTTVAMPFMNGGTLGDALARATPGAPLGESAARRILRGVACGLDTLHRHLGFVHHDLTPNNVLFFLDARPPPAQPRAGSSTTTSAISPPLFAAKASTNPSAPPSISDPSLLASAHILPFSSAIADFGCSCPLADPEFATPEPPRRTTTTSSEMEAPSGAAAISSGVFQGSVQYMSPERLAGHGSGREASADIWSLGVLALMIGLGTYPFDSSLDDHGQRPSDDATSPPRPTRDDRWRPPPASVESAAAAAGRVGFWQLVTLFGLHEPQRDLHHDRIAAVVGGCLARLSSPLLADFCKQCLQSDPQARPTALDLLDHPFLAAMDAS